jgi:signal transduction histidine kinase
MAEDLAKIAANLERSGQPLWLWEPKRRRIIWANRAGREFWGAQSLFDLSARSFAPQGPEARCMAKTGADVETSLNLPGGRVTAILDIAEIELPELGEARLVRLSRIQPPPRLPSRAHGNDLFQTAPIGLCLMDPQGRPLDENRAWGKLAGGPRRALSTLAGEDAAARFLLNCITNGCAEFSIKVESKRLRLFGKRLKQADGSMPLIYVRGEDVTVEHALENLLTQLAQNASAEDKDGAGSDLARLSASSGPMLFPERDERSGKTNSDIVSLFGDEMRNPLYAIIGFSEIMQQGHFGPLGNARYEAYSRDIRLSAERLLGLVNDLLDLARIEAGQLQLEYVDVALEPLIEECVRHLQPEAKKYSLVIETDISPELPIVIGDARSLRQVLINLLSNAIKFTRENGRIFVSAELEEDGALLLSIRDTGIGMSISETQHALEPFGQVEGAAQHGSDGPGLGLPVAKALAEENLAEFQVLSEPQRGTKIEIRFPPERVHGAKAPLTEATAAAG